MAQANTIGIGIVGVSSGDDPLTAGWANNAHLPALGVLDDYRLAGITSSTPEKARKVAERYGAQNAFGTVSELAASDDVDLVVITVKVPDHFAAVEAALDQGKAVFCEWPLGNGLEQAEQLVAKARKTGIRCGVGLQARAAPLIRYVRDLVRDGYVGDVLSTNLLGSGMNWGPGMLARNAYTLDRKNGAHLLTIPTGHALDPLEQVLGPFDEVRALSALRRSQIAFEDGTSGVATAEDQWVIAGRLASGAVASVHYRGGATGGQNLRWEINGTKGDLLVTSPFGHMQVLALELAGSQGGTAPEPMTVPESYRIVPEVDDPGLNIAQHYRLFASGSDEAATFEDALHLHKLIDAIERSAETGCAMVRTGDGAKESWGPAA